MTRPSTNTRRDFLKSAGAGASLIPYTFPSRTTAAPSKNARLQFAALGVGGRGSYLAEQTKAFGDLVAVCDVDRNHAQRVRERSGGKAQIYADYRNMCERASNMRLLVTRYRVLLGLLLMLPFAVPAAGEDMLWVTYAGDGSSRPGDSRPNSAARGKHIVFVTGDEEYRSEEAGPMLAKILAVRHGFKCTVLFAVDPKTGHIDPWEPHNIPGLHLLQDADAMVIFTRFRELPDEQMQHIVDFIDSGKGIVGIRPTCAGFRYVSGSKSPHAKWSYNRPGGGFGQQVLGLTWWKHHGGHGKERRPVLSVMSKKTIRFCAAYAMSGVRPMSTGFGRCRLARKC